LQLYTKTKYGVEYYLVWRCKLDTKYVNLIKSYVKVFISVVLGMFLADGADVFAVDMTDLRSWLAAGLASVIPLVLTALDPSDHRWGKNAE
jgi:hypothetical protein